MKQNLKWKIPHTVFERWILCFSSYKNRKLKVKLWWVGAPKRKKEGIFCIVYFGYCLYTVYYVLFNCIVYWIHFQNIHTFICQKTLLLTLFKLFWKLLKAVSVSLRTNILLHHIKKHFILIINQAQSIKTIYHLL